MTTMKEVSHEAHDLPSNRRQTDIELSGRYLFHVEDQPMLWQRRFESVGEAVQGCHDTVVRRREENGSGDGFVIDTLAGRVVCVFDGSTQDIVAGQRKLAVVQSWTAEGQEKMVSAALAREAGNDNAAVPFIWQTC